MNTHSPKRRPKKILRIAFLLMWLVLLVVIALNRQSIYDWWQLRDYTPPQTVSSLASQTTMTDYGRKVFYVNQPSLTSDEDFAKACPNSSQEQTIVLGCYHGSQGGIYLLDVRDPRLEGVEQVTAAHEMLHAAYDRLNSAERKRVDAMLEEYYKNNLTDERIKRTIDAYKQSEPDDLVNEMHSIFATEIVNLPSNLEQYYKKYFTNRAQIALFANKYQAEFSSREAAVDKADEQLATMKKQIDSLQSQVQRKQDEVASERRRLTSLRSSDVDAYNASVPGYNQLVESYNSSVEQLRALIASYNQLVATRNAIALEENQLVNALSNNVQTIQE